VSDGRRGLAERILVSPWAILVATVAGVATGIFLPPAAAYLGPVGAVFIALLQMCVIPIMVSAIVTSVGKLARSAGAAVYFPRVAGVFLCLLLVVSVASIAVTAGTASLIMPDAQTQSAIGRIMIERGSAPGGDQRATLIREIDSRVRPAEQSQERGLVDFLVYMIPKNIFSSLSEGEMLRILFFFMLLGVMLKYIPERASGDLILFFEGIYEIFQKVIRASMLILPFGLFALLATQIASTGPALLVSLAKLIALVAGLSLLFFAGSSVAIWRASGKPFLRQFAVLRNVIFISLGTRNSYAAIPFAISGLHKGLGFDLDRLNFSLPIGVTLCRYGNVMIYCVGAVFAFSLYERALGPESILMVVVGSLLTAMASSGTPGIVGRAMIALILTPLGIPSGAIMTILIVIDPITEPLITLLNVYPNCAAAALISGAGELRAEFKELSVETAG